MNRLLFLSLFSIFFGLNFFSQQLVINEVSQGLSGSKEYVELLVVGSPTCNAVPTMDLRGYYIDDNNGTFALGAGTGIAGGCVRLANIPFWQSIPYGTIIVIHNDGDVNPSIPANDLLMSDGNCKLVIPISNCALLERHTTLPSTGSAVYPTTGFIICGNWTPISMANGDDSFQTRDALATLVHAVSWGNNNIANIVYMGAASAGGQVFSMTNGINNNPALSTNWTIGNAGVNETPGVANNAANAAWIATMNNGCAIIQPFGATTASTNPGCTCNGLASITPTGAISPYTYTWNPSGGNASSASALCAGVYTVTSTSSNNCTLSFTYTLTSAGALTITPATTSVLCNGGNTGSATITPFGVAGPYTYTWTSSASTSSIASGLSAGNYTVSVSAGACIASTTLSIAQPTLALSGIVSATNILCNGASTGVASVTASGGSAGYTYTWSPSGGNLNLANGLAAGNYTITIKDNNNCTVTANTSITQPSSITILTNSVNPLCFGGTGSATLTVIGGVGGYTYTWNPSVSSASTASGLAGGNYSVTVGSGGCTNSVTLNIATPPSSITILTNSINPLCFGGTGSATVAASGGVGGYTYTWNPSVSSSSTTSGLNAGNYSVTIGSGGCTNSIALNIAIPPSSITILTNSINPLCFGGTGSATISASGGIGGYTYTWNPSVSSASTASGLNAGNYTVTIKDANNCTVTANASITQPASGLNGVINFSNTNCAGSIGSATVAGNGGTGVYTYTWLPLGGNAPVATGLAAGAYSVAINDANFCVALATVNIQSGNGGLTAVINGTNILCNGLSTGAATVGASSASPGYSYSWTPSGGTSALATNLLAGTYSVIITNTTCVSSGIELVTNGDFSAGNTGFSSAYVFTPPPNTGASQYYVAPATQVSVWNGGMFSTGDHTSGFGNFMMVNGSGTPGTNVFCQNIPVNSNTNYNFSTWVSSLNTGNQAQLQFYINGIPLGVGFNAPAIINNWIQFFAVWNSGGNTSANICIVNQNSTAGGNDFGLDDISFQECLAPCPITQTISITQPAAIVPVISPTNVLCFGGNSGTASVTTSGGSGAYSYTWSPSGGNAALANGLTAGNYTLSVADANNCTVTANTPITQPASALAGITTATNVLCFGGLSGVTSVTASGGTSPGYTYTWTPSGGNASFASNLSAANYTVTIKDVNNCTITVTSPVTQPASALAGVITQTNIICFGGSTGVASITANGGAAGYTYTWSPSGANITSQNGLSAGNYTVMIQDGNNCTVTANAIITQPAAALVGIITQTNVLCFGGNTGAISITINGGTPGYTYTWSPSGGNLVTAIGLSNGSYSVNIRDANNCTITANTSITQPASALSGINSSTNVLCFGGSTGATSVTATGGTAGYTYTWSPSGGNSDLASGLAIGNYNVLIKDANNCTNSASVIVTQPLQITAAITTNALLCFGFSNGSATVTASGGTGAYNYNWLPINNLTNIANNLSAGNYTVIVTDVNTCARAFTTSIIQPLQIQLTANAIKLCNGQTGNLAANVVGGTIPFTYNWNGQTGTPNTIALTLTATTIYTVSAVDANGCNSTIDTALISVSAPLNINVAAGYSLCVGNSTLVSAFGSGGSGNLNYIWQPGNLAGQSQLLSANGIQVYTVTVTDGCPSTKSATTAITGFLAPVSNAIVSQTTGCAPLCVTFSNSPLLSSGQILSYSWDFGDNNYSSFAEPNHCYKNKGVYNVTVNYTTIYGCTGSQTITNLITVNPTAVAQFICDPIEIGSYNTSVSFTNQSTFADSYEWTLDIEATSTLTNVNHTFVNEKEQYIILIAKNEFGCNDTTTRIIKFTPDFTFFAPNAFTPSDDGLNELFLPKGIGWDINRYQLEVYDRWGLRIFITNEFNKGWDGKVGGIVVKQDSYVWKAHVYDLNRKIHQYVGHITVLKVN